MLSWLLPYPSAASVTRKFKHAWQLTSGLCFYRLSTVGHSKALKIWTVVEVASGRGRSCMAWTTLINVGNCQAHELIVKLSPCTCIAILVVLAGEMAGICDTCMAISGWGFDYKLSDKSCYMPWQISKPEHFQSPLWMVNGYACRRMIDLMYYFTHQWHSLLRLAPTMFYIF